MDESDFTLPFTYPILAKQSHGASIKWLSHGRTDTGKRRARNEDAMLSRPESGIWVVADGMGGHQSGDIASSLVVAGLSEIENGLEQEIKIANVKERLDKVNAELFAYAQSQAKGSIIGTTVVVLVATGLQCAVIWAGDSRLYRYRAGQLQQITQDHTLINQLIASGMSQHQAEQRAGANVITSAIGGGSDVNLEVKRFQAEPQDRYLLCSDGLDKEVSDEHIAQLMAGDDCQTIADALIEQVLAQTARDNVTVIVCEAVQATTDTYTGG